MPFPGKLKFSAGAKRTRMVRMARTFAGSGHGLAPLPSSATLREETCATDGRDSGQADGGRSECKFLIFILAYLFALATNPGFQACPCAQSRQMEMYAPSLTPTPNLDSQGPLIRQCRNRRPPLRSGKTVLNKRPPVKLSSFESMPQATTRIEGHPIGFQRVFHL